MADKELRELERKARQGDIDSQVVRLQHLRCRVGEHCACSSPIGANIGVHYRAVGNTLNNETDLVFGDDRDFEHDSEHYELVLTIDLDDDDQNRRVLGAIAQRLGIPEPDLTEPGDKPCPYCKAVKGEGCKTSSGKSASEPHAGRSAASPGLRPVEDARRSTSVHSIYGGDDHYDHYYEMS